MAVLSMMTSRMPDAAASVSDWVAIKIRQFALRMTLSHSRILPRNVSCPSMIQASSSTMAAGCPCRERSIRRNR